MGLILNFVHGLFFRFFTLSPYIVFLHTYSTSSSIKDESWLFPLSSLNCGGQIVLLSQAVATKIAAEPAASERGRTTQCGF